MLGGEDLPHIKEAANLLAKGITAGRLVTIPGAGHIVNLDARERFNEELTQFLSAK